MVDLGPAVIPAVVDESRVHRLVGSWAATRRFTVGGATVVVGPEGTVIIAEPGDGLNRSGVWSAQEYRLIGAAPTPLAERLVGSRTWSADHSQLPIHLLARFERELVYLGRARVRQSRIANGTLTSCHLRFDSPLTRDLLDQLRPPLSPEELPDLEWIHHVNSDRSTALTQFVTDWYPADVGPTEPLPARSRSPLPGSLEQLYSLAEQRRGVLGVQNRILPAPDLHVDERGEMLVFGVENQGGFQWSLQWTLDDDDADPTVWFCEDDEEPIAEQEPLSGFLIQFSLFEAAMSADYRALPRKLSATQVQQLTQALQPVPLRPFWPGAPTRFYAAPGLVMYVSDGGNGEFDAWAGATCRSALAPLAELSVYWTRFDG